MKYSYQYTNSIYMNHMLVMLVFALVGYGCVNNIELSSDTSNMGGAGRSWELPISPPLSHGRGLLVDPDRSPSSSKTINYTWISIVIKEYPVIDMSGMRMSPPNVVFMGAQSYWGVGPAAIFSKDNNDILFKHTTDSWWMLSNIGHDRLMYMRFGEIVDWEWGAPFDIYIEMIIYGNNTYKKACGNIKLQPEWFRYGILFRVLDANKNDVFKICNIVNNEEMPYGMVVITEDGSIGQVDISTGGGK